MMKNTRHQIFLALLLTGASGSGWAQSSGLTTLYTFTNPADGIGPNTSVTIDKNGVLYGTTGFGGDDNSGVVFSLTPPASPGGTWSEQVLYSFNGNGTVRAGATGALVIDSHGNVYGGTTGSFSQYVASFNGTLYALKPPSSEGEPWKHTVLCSFTPDDGPVGIAMGKGGVVYGINGAEDGIVFSCTPPAAPGGAWTETVLYNVPNGGSTNFNANVVLSKNGVIYSTSNATVSAGGTVFSLTPPSSPGGAWAEATLYGFPAVADGINPDGLTMGHGVLYGTTTLGGSSSSVCAGLQPGCGVVYELTPPASGSGAWTQTILHTFQNTPDGEWPNPVVAGPGGVLYGTTYGGGAFNNGTIFSLTPPTSADGSWTYAVLYSFTGGNDYGNPSALTLGPNGVLYGTTYESVFSFQP